MTVHKLPAILIEPLVKMALGEDLGRAGDIRQLDLGRDGELIGDAAEFTHVLAIRLPCRSRRGLR